MGKKGLQLRRQGAGGEADACLIVDVSQCPDMGTGPHAQGAIGHECLGGRHAAALSKGKNERGFGVALKLPDLFGGQAFMKLEFLGHLTALGEV